MSNRKLRELLNREIDGILTEREKRALDSLLAKDEDARALRADLHSLLRLCTESPLAEPPPTLRPAIRRAIEVQQTTKQQPRRIKESLDRVLFPLRDLRLVYAFVGGIALGGVSLALVLSSVQPSDMSEQDVAGSLFARNADETLWTTHAIVTSAAKGRIATFNEGTLEAMAVQLDCARPVDARFQIDIGSRTVRFMSRPEFAQTTLEFIPGRVIVRGNQINDLRIVLGPPASHKEEPVRVTLFENGVSVYEHDLFEAGGGAAESKE